MKALLCSSPSSSIFLRNSPPIKLRIRLISPTSFPIPHTPQNPPRNLQANAKGKGFSGGVNPKPKQSVANKNPIQILEKEEEEPVPDVVIKRILKRILIACGVPLGMGLTSMKFYGEAKNRGLELPLWVPFTIVLVFFSASTLGIAYGALSTSWDPEKLGSVIGLEEAQKNWVEVWKEENN